MKLRKSVSGMMLAAILVIAGCGNDSGKQEAGIQTAASGNSATVSESSQAANPSQDPDEAQSASEESEHTEGGDEVVNGMKDLVDTLEKGAENRKVDWDIVDKTYSGVVQETVQRRDDEAKAQTDQQLTAAAKAGRDGSLSVAIVSELFDKLLQKTAFLQIRHELKEANEHFKNPATVKQELDEALVYYNGILKPMLDKRDAAYGTSLSVAVDGGFSQMKDAAEKDDNLAYNMGKQLVDKTLMKAFYLASGAEKGYGFKVEAMVKDGDAEKARIGQAEGWAFFQSLKSYLETNAKDDADLIESRFDLSSDVKNVKGDEIQQAYIRAFAKTALGEYGETFENWGKDKAAITALEGALFIDILSLDTAKALGSADKSETLASNAQKLLDEVKAGQKAEAEATYKLVKADLDTLAKYGSAGK